jgi:hypothetical protein
MKQNPAAEYTLIFINFLRRRFSVVSFSVEASSSSAYFSLSHLFFLTVCHQQDCFRHPPIHLHRFFPSAPGHLEILWQIKIKISLNKCVKPQVHQKVMSAKNTEGTKLAEKKDLL